jgi:hypothetical protein
MRTLRWLVLIVLVVPAPAWAATPRAEAGVSAGTASEGACQKKKRRRRKSRARAKDPKPEQPAETPARSPEPAAGSELRRSSRMEFDARLLQGESAGSGAVYLFQRARRRLPRLLTLEQSYVRRIVGPVLGPEAAERAAAAVANPADANPAAISPENPASEQEAPAR